MRRHPLPLLLLAATVIAFAPAAAAAQEPGVEREARAREAAEAWLAIMDADDFERSWREAGAMFRGALTAEAWSQQAAGVRAQIGAVTSRDLAAIEFVQDPPGAPPGEYAQVRFSSAFERSGPVTEVVVLAPDEERGWAVVGYFVQP